MSNESYPSSFDGNTDFHEENRLQKLGRKLKEEPLVPLGCILTCIALYKASKSMRLGDHEQTNRMFRARIYAQGFTLAAVVAGGMYYKQDRGKRQEYNRAVAEKVAREKRDAWIKELEARDREDQEWRERHKRIEEAAREAEAKGKSVGGAAKMMLEEGEIRSGIIVEAVRELKRRNR